MTGLHDVECMDTMKWLQLAQVITEYIEAEQMERWARTVSRVEDRET